MRVVTHQLYTDGGARGNPGPAAIGGVIKKHGQVLDEFSQLIGATTNNQAEYRALIQGLALAHDRGVVSIDCFLDSELVVKQLGGAYRIKDAGLKELAHRVQILSRKFDHISFTHISRYANKRADQLVNKALDNVNA